MAAQKQSVLSASAQSSVWTSEGVKFENNNSHSADGFTMAFDNIELVDIADASFIGN